MDTITLPALPWGAETRPLMLAPMQGLTNRALRSLFIDRAQPDVLFTEFVRVRPSAKRPIANSDRLEVAVGRLGDPPLVVQVIGSDTAALVAAATVLQELGVSHINLNMGCPFGRMTATTAGGSLLKHPGPVLDLLAALRQAIKGTFSVKTRSGFDRHDQIFSLLPLFAEAGVDFLILHPRTVVQRYTGAADHAITAAVVRQATMPVIANGDICTAATAGQVLETTGAAGLMLGRGAISDPLLFARIRGTANPAPLPATRAAELQVYLGELVARYEKLFCGEAQILVKMKEVLCYVRLEGYDTWVREMKRARSMERLVAILSSVPQG